MDESTKSETAGQSKPVRGNDEDRPRCKSCIHYRDEPAWGEAGGCLIDPPTASREWSRVTMPESSCSRHPDFAEFARNWERIRRERRDENFKRRLGPLPGP